MKLALVPILPSVHPTIFSQPRYAHQTFLPYLRDVL